MRFVASILGFAAERAIPVVRFETLRRGQRKDGVAHEHLARLAEPEGVYAPPSTTTPNAKDSPPETESLT